MEQLKTRFDSETPTLQMTVGIKYELDEVKCPTCNRKDFASELGVRTHHSIVHNERIPNLICENCGDKFFYTTRRAKCDECKPVPCPKEDCSRRFENINHRNIHHKYAHDSSLVKTECPSCNEEKYYETNTTVICGCGKSLKTNKKNTIKKEPQPCPNCDREFVNMGQHWKSQNCEYPALSREQKDIIRGLVMSDASIQQSKTNNLTISLTEPAFLEWLAEKLDCICNTEKYPNLKQTAKEAKESAIDYFGENAVNSESKYKPKYRLLTRSHPFLNEFDDWYVPEKRYPLDDLDLTSTVAKMWYIGDGTLEDSNTSRPRAEIACANEKDRLEEVADLIREQGFEPCVRQYGKIAITSSDTPAFLEWLGEAPPGFEYKWITG